MYVNEKRYRRIIIENLGDFNFDFVINKNSQFISFSQEQGSVKAQNKFTLEVIFAPLSRFKLRPKTCYFILNIISGPSYKFVLKGEGKTPGV